MYYELVKKRSELVFELSSIKVTVKTCCGRWKHLIVSKPQNPELNKSGEKA